MIKIANFSKNINFALCGNFRSLYSKSKLSEKIFAISVPVFISAFCVLPRHDLESLIRRAFKCFYGKKGFVDPILMLSTCLTLKYFSNIDRNNSSNHSLLTSKNLNVNYLEKIPENFIAGASHLPTSILVKLLTIAVTGLALKALSVHQATSATYSAALRQSSLFEVAIQAPFLEELFFRECLQGSLISIMKLTNLAVARISKGAIIPEQYANNFCRIVSAIAFGLGHSKQSLLQGAAAGVSSYYYETWLYEKNGLFASFGHHFANNLLVFSLFSIRKKS